MLSCKNQFFEKLTKFCSLKNFFGLFVIILSGFYVARRELVIK